MEHQNVDLLGNLESDLTNARGNLFFNDMENNAYIRYISLLMGAIKRLKKIKATNQEFIPCHLLSQCEKESMGCIGYENCDNYTETLFRSKEYEQSLCPDCTDEVPLCQGTVSCGRANMLMGQCGIQKGIK